MGYDKSVYLSAETILKEKKAQAEAQAERRRAVFYRECPRAGQIDQILTRTAAAAARAVLNGKDVHEQLTNLKNNNLALQKEFQSLLQGAGYPADYLEPKYSCPKCRDTGYIDGKMCSCMKQLLRREAYTKLNALTPLSLSTFDSFDLNYYTREKETDERYSPYDLMERNLQYCKRYAEQFSLKSPSLLLQGGTGLGKTHLSLAVANTAIDKGFGVVYGSVQNLTEKLEAEHFSNEHSANTNQMLLDCDLLILDDLGTEFNTPFVTASIYNIVNTRQMTNLPTIISTNLSVQEMQKRYSERFASRIIGGYVRIPFLGRDVRQLKRMKKGN